MKKIFAVFLVIFLISCSKNTSKNMTEIAVDNGKNLIRISVEIADNNGEREKGFMLREKLNWNEGMLFVFEKEDYQAFWMKNTLIPLDLIFIGENFRIADIKNAAPCRGNPCAIYRSSAPARYVLEVNSNFTGKNHIKVGDKMIFSS